MQGAPGCTGVATSLAAGDCAPSKWASSWGGSDSPVQVELFQEALTPGVVRDRGQAGKLVLDGDPVHGQRRFGVPSGRSGASAGVAC